MLCKRRSCLKSRKGKLWQRLYFKFKVAYEGLVEGLMTDISIQIQVGFGLTAAVIAFIFGFSAIEWAIWLICIGLVITLEYLNSAFEQMLDRFDPTYHVLTKRAKDLGAAAVLVSALISLVIGLIFITQHI